MDVISWGEEVKEGGWGKGFHKDGFVFCAF